MAYIIGLTVSYFVNQILFCNTIISIRQLKETQPVAVIKEQQTKFIIHLHEAKTAVIQSTISVESRKMIDP